MLQVFFFFFNGVVLDSNAVPLDYHLHHRAFLNWLFGGCCLGGAGWTWARVFCGTPLNVFGIFITVYFMITAAAVKFDMWLDAVMYVLFEFLDILGRPDGFVEWSSW